MSFLSQYKFFLSGLLITAIGTTLLYLNETVWCYIAQPGCPDNTSGPVATIAVIGVGVVLSILAHIMNGSGESK